MRADPNVIRFVDLAVPPGVRNNTIDGLRKRVLEPFKDEQVFKLERVGPAPVLSFSMGRRPFEGTSTVRFEIWLRQTGQASTQLYSRDISRPGWVDERLDLSGRTLEGAELVFLRSIVEGPGPLLFTSAWGDPILHAGTAAVGPSVLFISLDTLRADRVGVYGNVKAHTPNLDALARSGVWYTQAYSPSTWTYPSHESMFFGTYPAIHPCPDPSGPQPKGSACPDQFQPLSEIYRQAGNLTAGFTGGGYLSYNFGFSRGFDSYYMFPQPPLQFRQCTPEQLDGGEACGPMAARSRSHTVLPLRPHLRSARSLSVSHQRARRLPLGIRRR